MRRSNVLRTWCLVALLTLPVAAWGGEAGKLKILLLGDSTTIGSVCRQADPDGPHLEDVIRLLLATEKDLPPSEVINQGRDGEYIRGLLSSGRYDKEIAPLGGVDYVLIRYGLNDVGKREEFEANFPKDYAELIGRLRRDYPRATIVPMTIIPYMTPERDEAINALIRKVAESERLALFDVYARYRAELSHGPNMLNYRRYPLEKIPERHREWVKPFVRGGQVVVMDNRLDAHFRELPGWFGDRHPNLAGYHVIGDESAKFLAKLIREKRTTGADLAPEGAAKPPGTGLEFIDTGFENASPLWYEAAPDGTVLVHLALRPRAVLAEPRGGPLPLPAPRQARLHAHAGVPEPGQRLERPEGVGRGRAEGRGRLSGREGVEAGPAGTAPRRPRAADRHDARPRAVRGPRRALSPLRPREVAQVDRGAARSWRSRRSARRSRGAGWKSSASAVPTRRTGSSSGRGRTPGSPAATGSSRAWSTGC